MDLDIALEFVNQIVATKTGRDLRPPEIIVFRGTWLGVTYEQMAESSSYSSNYLMRDIAPKFWKLLSNVLETNIGKSNLRIQLCKLHDFSQVELTQKLDSKSSNLRRNWDSAIALPSVFYGRNNEIETLKQWATVDQCQLIELWGLSGIGKTLLMKKIGEQLQEQYEVVIWRSLIAAPKLNELVTDLLYTGFGIIENNNAKLLPKLLEQMRSHSCLIMLDGIETVLKPQEFSGKYLSGYQDYADFWQLIGKSSHQSCMITTCLENFGRTMFATEDNSTVRNLKLKGLSISEAQPLLAVDSGDSSISDTSQNLIRYYQGNPAILGFAAQIIRNLFNGNLQEFVEQQSLVFGEIDRSLRVSFNRLSTLETEILYWLASESKPKSLAEIQDGIPLSIYSVELIEALESLTQRSLIEITQIQQRSVFTLLPMIQEFVVNQFIAQIGDNFSFANRQNSPLGQETIELSGTSQITHLSQWLQNKFETGWQPVETLFAASGRSPARLRSAFSLRGAGVVKRFKQINLGRDHVDNVEILLLIAVSQEESALKICVQAQPTLNQQTLPPRLQLSLISPDNSVLATIASELSDNFIQLPYFRGVKNENFLIGINLQQESEQVSSPNAKTKKKKNNTDNDFVSDPTSYLEKFLI